MPNILKITGLYSVLLAQISSLAMEPPGPPPTPLEKHWQNFFSGTTKRKHTQVGQKAEEKTELQQKLELQALRVAVTDNDVESVDRLLVQGVAPNASHNLTLRTLLHTAATLGRAQVLHRLLHSPTIDTTILDQSNHPPIFYALNRNHTLCLIHFVEHQLWTGPDILHYTAFHLAAEKHHKQALIILLTHCLHQSPHLDYNGSPTEQAVDDQVDTPIRPLKTCCFSFVLEQLQQAFNQKNKNDVVTLWREYTAILPQDLLGVLTQRLTETFHFCDARSFTCAFAIPERQEVAKLLAPYYAKRHLKLVNQHLATVAKNNTGMPYDIARNTHAPEIMQQLTHPVNYIVTLNMILQTVSGLGPRLTKDPKKQNPLDLFTALFEYRLQGKTIRFYL